MKYSIKGTSIIEAMIVLLVVVTGITGVYGLLISSQKLANATSMRIEAIQIARDGLEAFINIRDSNWTLFAADYRNCWNTLNYNDACIGVTTIAHDIKHSTNEGFKVYRDSTNKFRLALGSYASGDGFEDASYRNLFQIQKETINGFYTQSGGTLYGAGSTPYYTREIKVEYIDSSGLPGTPIASLESNLDIMKITAIVQWNDTAKDEPQKLEMTTLLTNWKSKK